MIQLAFAVGPVLVLQELLEKLFFRARFETFYEVPAAGWLKKQIFALRFCSTIGYRNRTVLKTFAQNQNSFRMLQVGRASFLSHG